MIKTIPSTIYSSATSGKWRLAAFLMLFALALPGAQAGSYHVMRHDEGHSHDHDADHHHHSTLEESLQKAQMLLQRGRQQGYVHYYLDAEKILAPWVSRQIPEMQLLQAQIAQYHHRFDEALALLDDLVKEDTSKRQALLQRAYVLMMQGQLRQAAADCVSLAGEVSAVISATCLAQIRAQQGQAGLVYDSLLSLAKQQESYTEAERHELNYTLAKLAQYAGDEQAAASWFEALLHNEHRTLEDEAAFADFLLTSSRWQEVIDFVSTRSQQHIALIVRQSIAEKMLAPESSTKTGIRLAKFFAEELKHNADYTSRVYVLYQLHWQQDVQAASTSAYRNWQQQKAHEDTVLAYQLAKRAGNSAAITAIENWAAANNVILQGWQRYHGHLMTARGETQER